MREFLATRCSSLCRHLSITLYLLRPHLRQACLLLTAMTECILQPTHTHTHFPLHSKQEDGGMKERKGGRRVLCFDVVAAVFLEVYREGGRWRQRWRWGVELVKLWVGFTKRCLFRLYVKATALFAESCFLDAPLGPRNSHSRPEHCG